jgi:antitoxin MazE
MKVNMRVQVKKWGNSAAVRIPASVMAAAALSIDQSVEVREEGQGNRAKKIMRR